jgi:hypothetical protein
MIKPVLTAAKPVATPSPMSSPVRFDRPFLVLVEGVDDQAVVAVLVKKMELDGFQIHDMGGNGDWPSKLRAITLDESFSVNVRALGLVRDADQNPTGTWTSCTSAINQSGLTAPERTGELGTGSPATCVTIVPSPSRAGAIEDLCLDSFSQNRMECVNSYFTCLDKSRSNGARRPKKSHVQAYLAGLIPPVRDIRIAAERDVIDFSHSAFDELKEFLRLLSSASEPSMSNTP